MHTNSDRRKDTVASQRTIVHIKTHEERIVRASPLAQGGRRNPAAAPPLSIREAASQQRAVSPRDRCRSTVQHVLTPTQTNTNNLDCCANQFAVAGRSRPNHRKRSRQQARVLSQLALAETHPSQPFCSARCVPRDRIVAADTGYARLSRST